MSEIDEPITIPESNSNKDLKIGLEIEKLQNEIQILKTGYLKRIIVPVLMPSLITACVTIVSIYVIYLSIVSKENQQANQNMLVANENVLKNNKLVLDAIELTKKKNDLTNQQDEINSSISESKKQQTQLQDSLSYISNQVTLKFKENTELKNLTNDLKKQNQIIKETVDKFPDSLSKEKLLQHLEDIDTKTVFYYNLNPKSYSKFGEKIKASSQSVFNDVILSYIASPKNLFVNRLYVLMVAYNYADKKNELLDIYQKMLVPELCNTQRSAEFNKVVTCKEWNDEIYHKTIKFILREGISHNCPVTTYILISVLLERNDIQLSASQDGESLIAYLSIFRTTYIKKESKPKNILSILNCKNVSFNLQMAYISEYVLMNKEGFKPMIEESEYDSTRIKRKQPSMAKTLSGKLKISETDLTSIEYWKTYQIQNSALIKRLMEDDFTTYRNNKALLIADMQ